MPTEAEERQTEYLWTLSVDDTESYPVNGYTMVCTLQLSTVKEGGADVMGVFKARRRGGYTGNGGQRHGHIFKDAFRA